MREMQNNETQNQGRVLARVLAEEIRSVQDNDRDNAIHTFTPPVEPDGFPDLD